MVTSIQRTFLILALSTANSTCFQYDYDLLGYDLSERPIQGITDPKECKEYCQKDVSCFYFSVNLRNEPIENNGCWLKKDVERPPTHRAGVIFGPKYCEDNSNGKVIF